MRIRHGALTRHATSRGLPPKVATSIRRAPNKESNVSSPASRGPGHKVDSRPPSLSNTQWLISRFMSWVGTRRLWEWIWERAFRSYMPAALEDSEHDSELIKFLNTRFAGSVRIDPRETALQVARSEYTLNCVDRLVFWSDASIRKGTKTGYGAGISVVWRDRYASHGWQNKTYILNGYFSTSEAEFFGIAEAMNIATAMVKSSDPFEGHSRATKVVIYSDNQGCLGWVKEFETVGPVRQYTFTRQRELAILKKRAKALVNMGVDLELRWVPGHAGVPGNSMADMLAGRASKFGGSLFGGLRYNHLEPVVDAYLQTPPRSVVLKNHSRYAARITKRISAPTFHMRFRSVSPARAASADFRQSSPPSPKIVKQNATKSARLAGKRMERFHKRLQTQVKQTMISGSLLTTRRSSSPITRPFTRTIIVDGVTKKVASRPPPPSRLLQPRAVHH